MRRSLYPSRETLGLHAQASAENDASTNDVRRVSLFYNLCFKGYVCNQSLGCTMHGDEDHGYLNGTREVLDGQCPPCRWESVEW